MKRTNKLFSLVLLLLLTFGVSQVAPVSATVGNVDVTTANSLLAPSDITTGLIARYAFEANANDSSGNGYNGTATNITYGAGKVGQAAQFNDVNSKVEVPALAGNLPGGNSARSVAFWVYRTASTDGNMVSWGANANAQRFSVLHANTGLLCLIGQFYDFCSGYTIPGSTWTHVVVTYDGSTLRYYANGTLNSTSVAGAFNTSAANMLRMGVNVVGREDEFFGGSLDEVRIYNRALSAADVTELYNYTDCSASIIVLNNNNGGAGSLRQAITDVCDGGTITFNNSLSGGTIALTSVIIIDKNVTLDGSALASQVTVSGGGSTGMFAIYYADIDVTFNNMTFTGGNATQDPFGFTGDGRGGAFHNAGHLTINNSTLSNNAASFAGGAIYNDPYHSVPFGGPGPIPTLVINNSTFRNNTTTRYGGAVMNEAAQMTISNSTFHQNSATSGGVGGAIMNQLGVSPSGIYNSTIANNTASNQGGGVWLNGNSSISFTLNNVILANNTAPVDADCWKAVSSILNGNKNIIKTGSCPGPTNTITSDPNLGTLADNGGPTQTMALLSGSPALDAGDDGVCAAAPVNNLDQRGIARSFGPHCDIGAYEYSVPLVMPGAAGGLGPGGVGHTDGSTPMELWLRSDRATYSNVGCTTPAVNAGPVGCWQDQSGNNNHATQGTGGAQPIYTTNALNGQPVLQFDGSTDLLNMPNGTVPIGNSAYSVFALVNSDVLAPRGFLGSGNYGAVNQVNAFRFDASGAIVNYWWGTDLGTSGGTVTTGVNYVLSFVYNTGTGRTAWVNGTIPGGGTNGSVGRNGAATNNTIGKACPFCNGGEFWDGTIEEIVIFSSSLNNAERILVENYLSAKYNRSVTVDVYDGDTNGNGDFDLDVAGIGRFGGNNHTQAHAAGMVVVNSNFLQDNGDWLLFGHRTLVNGNATADLPTGGDWDGNKDVRWARHWYIDVTDAAGVNCATPGTCFVNIVFDFSDAGMDGDLPPNGPASNYRLLKRTLGTGPFSDIATATAVVGDQVQFLNVDVSLLGSNFTLGSIDGAASPTAITMQHAASSVSQPGYLVGLAGVLALLVTTAVVVRRRRA